MFSVGCADTAAPRELLDLAGLADIDAMHGDLASAALPIRRQRSAAGLVAIGQREVAPRAASASASARPMPLAAPVTAAADPVIAVIGCPSKG